jgi:catechol 2,3-dioxygenase
MSEVAKEGTVQARGLGCLVFSVRDAERSKDFYVRLLGFKVVREDAQRKYVLLAKGDQDQRIALVERATGEPPGPTQPGMIHMAWELGSFEALQDAYRELGALGVKFERTVQHHVTRSIYFRDPDNNCVELFCNRWENGFEAMRDRKMGTAPLNVETGEAGEWRHF